MIAEDYCQFYDGKKMGIIDEDGNVVIPAVYDMVETGGDEWFTVRKGDTTGYFDVNGNIVLLFQNKYECYGNFTEGLARVRFNSKWGYINKSGEEAISPQFHFAYEFIGGYAVVRNEEDWYGAIDRSGNLIIPYLSKCHLWEFNNGYFKFGDLKTCGLINTSGEIVVPQIYNWIEILDNSKAIVRAREGEDIKEGVLTIGGEVEWNDNMKSQNELRRKMSNFSTRCESFIEKIYVTGCPCESRNFRSYIQWSKPFSFIDQELLFLAFSKKLINLENNIYRCPKCETLYNEVWEEYSAFHQVLNVKIVSLGKVQHAVEKTDYVIPTALGFNNYTEEKLSNYQQSDVESVMQYLFC